MRDGGRWRSNGYPATAGETVSGENNSPAVRPLLIPSQLGFRLGVAHELKHEPVQRNIMPLADRTETLSGMP
jgi:hypothetical protein